MSTIVSTLKQAVSGRNIARLFVLTEEEKQKRYVDKQRANCSRYHRHLKNELNNDENKEINLNSYHRSGGRVRELMAQNILMRMEGKPMQQLLFQKYNIVRGAIEILLLEGDSQEGIEKYKQYLFDNRKLLAQRRDDHCTTFLKGLGVAVGTAFGLVGGYVAYHSFFGNRATEGKKLYQESKQNLSFNK